MLWRPSDKTVDRGRLDADCALDRQNTHNLKIHTVPRLQLVHIPGPTLRTCSAGARPSASPERPCWLASPPTAWQPAVATSGPVRRLFSCQCASRCAPPARAVSAVRAQWSAPPWPHQPLAPRASSESRGRGNLCAPAPLLRPWSSGAGRPSRYSAGSAPVAQCLDHL